MRKPKQKQQTADNFSADTASADLFQAISDKQAETIKGGLNHEWERYCHTALKVKGIPVLW